MDFALIAGMFLLASSAQSQIFWIIIAAIRLGRVPRIVAAIAGGAVIAFIVVAPFYAVPMHALDHNSSVRAILWRDVWEAMEQTGGIGIGYGTEYIKNRFEEIMYWGWYIGDSPTDIFVATHSTFYDVLLREGFIGLALFCYWFLPYFRVPGDRTLPETRLLCAVSVLLVINSSVNVGLSSITFLFGSVIGLAFLQAAKRQGRPDPAPSGAADGYRAPSSDFLQRHPGANANR